jgi:hypothetical protein
LHAEKSFEDSKKKLRELIKACKITLKAGSVTYSVNTSAADFI